MAKTKSRTVKSKPPRRLPTLPAWMLRGTLRAATTVLLLMLFGWGWLAGEAVLRRTLTGYGVVSDPSGVAFGSPEWLRPDHVPSLLPQQVSDSGATDGVAADLPALLGRRLEDLPLIRRVRVERTAGGVAVEVRWRRPVLALLLPTTDGDLAAYLDGEGRLLPAAALAAAGIDDCLVLEGVRDVSLPEAGQRVGDPRLRQAAAVAAWLQPYREESDIAALRLDGPTDAATPTAVELSSRDGRRFRWSDDLAAEAPVTDGGQTADAAVHAANAARRDRLLAAMRARFGLPGPAEVPDVARAW